MEMTKKDLTQKLLSHISGIRKNALRTATKEEAVDSVLHSLLCAIDGVGFWTIGMPITLVVEPTPLDEVEDRIAEGSDWIAKATPLNDAIYLHEMIDWDQSAVPFYPELIARYRELIEEGIRLNAFPSGQYRDGEHLLKMLSELEAPGKSLTKKHRWLGFIQCSLISAGLTTVDAERNHTRTIFNGQ